MKVITKEKAINNTFKKLIMLRFKDKLIIKDVYCFK